MCGISALPPCTENRENTGFEVLRLLYNDSYSSKKSLLLKAERPTMKMSRLRRLAIEVFKTLKSLNPDFKHKYFKKSQRNYIGT